MKKTFILAALSLPVFAATVAGAQGKALETATYAVPGNCDNCRKLIESAASVKGVKQAKWDASHHVLTVRYRPAKVSPGAILRSVAYAGFDNEKYLAPETAYKSLEACCRYEREAIRESVHHDGHAGHEPHTQDQGEPVKTQEPPVAAGHEPDEQVQQAEKSGIEEVYEQYFRMKDMLVKDDPAGAAGMAAAFLKALAGVKMLALDEKGHEAFMNSSEVLKANAAVISGTKDLDKQRLAFSSLSTALYPVMKKMKPPYDVYLDHCPMYNKGKGADWLSREKSIRNPYYGSGMMTCGKVKETIR